MAWNASSKEPRTTEFRSWQVEVGGYGNQAVNSQLLKLTCDTRDIYSIDLLEISYRAAAAEVGNLDLVNLAWTDGSRNNDNNKHFRRLAPLFTGGIYIGEYNVPRNLYQFNGTDHRPYSQNFELQIIKEISGSLLNTDYVLITLKITARHVGGNVHYEPRYEGVILNDRT